jgi:hypothetical protein
MGLSSGYGSVGSNEERFKILDRAVELGSTFWDSSDVCMEAPCLVRVMSRLITIRCRQRRPDCRMVQILGQTRQSFPVHEVWRHEKRGREASDTQ